ncbi:chemotaxis protein [bacterium]|nr:chemotaxis protein [bacterium]
MTDLAIPSPPVDVFASRRAEFGARISEVSTRAEAEKVAREFERMFLAEMLQPMFAGIKTDGPFGGGSSEEMFRPMLIDRYAEAMANAGGIGIAKSVLGEILKLQGLDP